MMIIVVQGYNVNKTSAKIVHKIVNRFTFFRRDFSYEAAHCFMLI